MRIKARDYEKLTYMNLWRKRMKIAFWAGVVVGASASAGAGLTLAFVLLLS